jgi:DNA gyrase/topoisomerase IV subunit A
VGVLSHDARHRPVLQESLPLAVPGDDGDPPPPYAVAITAKGRALRFPLAGHEEVSTRAGRKYARLNTGDQVFVAYALSSDEQRLCVASTQGRATVFRAGDIPLLRAAGKGVTGIKLKADDDVMACELASGVMQGPTVVTSFGRELAVRERKFGLNKRGARGRVVLKRGTIDVWKREPVVLLDADEMKKLAPREVSVEEVADDAADPPSVRADAVGEE